MFEVIELTASSVADAGADNATYHHQIAGDLLALLSAVLYAVYIVWMRRHAGDEVRATANIIVSQCMPARH